VKLLFVGDMAATGFGSVTTDLGRAMLERGLDVRFLSQNNLDANGLPEPFASRTIDLAFYEYQQGTAGVTGVRSMLGDVIDGIPGHLLANGTAFGDWKPDAVLILSDFAAARLLHARFADELQRVPVWHYVPIEGVDLPPLWAQLWSLMRPIAMSKFGQEQIHLVTGRRPALAYHGVDQQAFYPVSPSNPLSVPKSENPADGNVVLTSKEAAKRFFGFDPRWTVILRTDRNMPRKRYGSLLRALDPVLADREDARLVIHAAAFDQGGFLPDSVSKMTPAGGSRVIVTDRPGLPRSVLAALYNAADLYVTTSAEGFGLCIAEALACGVPAVGMDYSAVPEVIGPAGVTVPVAQLYDNEYDHKWAWPAETLMGDAVARLVDKPARRRELGAMGPTHVARHFSWAAAAEVIEATILAG
jgi:glycosyltransferase involved in cell wall biosynthesis